MTLKEILYAVFYVAVFVLSVWAGHIFGFTDTHTPPLPFAIEICCLAIAVILLFIDVVLLLLMDDVEKRPMKIILKLWVHVVGITANGLVILYILQLNIW